MTLRTHTMALARQCLAAAALAVCALVACAHPGDEIKGALAVPTPPGEAVAIIQPAAVAIPTPGPAVAFEVTVSPVASESPSEEMPSTSPEGSAMPIETAAATAAPLATEAMATPMVEISLSPMAVESTITPASGAQSTNDTAPAEETGPVVVDASGMESTSAPEPTSAAYMAEDTPMDASVAPTSTPGVYYTMEPTTTPYVSPMYATPAVQYSTQPTYSVGKDTEWTPEEQGPGPKPIWQPGDQDSQAEWEPEGQDWKPEWKPEDQGGEWSPEGQDVKPIWKPDETSKKPEWEQNEHGSDQHWPDANPSSPASNPSSPPSNPSSPPDFNDGAKVTAVPPMPIAVPVPEEGHVPVSPDHGGPSVIIEISGPDSVEATPAAVTAMPIPKPENEGSGVYWTPAPQPLSTQQPGEEGDKQGWSTDGENWDGAKEHDKGGKQENWDQGHEHGGQGESWDHSNQDAGENNQKNNWDAGKEHGGEDKQKENWDSGTHHDGEDKQKASWDEGKHHGGEGPVSADPQPPQATPQPKWMSPEDAACTTTYDGCLFNFVGVHGLQSVDLGAASPTWISHALALKSGGGQMTPRMINANNLVPEFVFPDGAQPITNFGSPRLDRLAVRTVSKRGDRTVIMHGQLSGNQATVLKGKCVRVFFSAYELIGQGGRSIGVRHMYQKEKGQCVVFRIKR